MKKRKNRPWEKNCTILSFKKSKYGEQKAEVKLESPGLVCAFKLWETMINGGLELLGFLHLMFVWGNMIYPKTKLTSTQNQKTFYLKACGLMQRIKLIRSFGYNNAIVIFSLKKL